MHGMLNGVNNARIWTEVVFCNIFIASTIRIKKYKLTILTCSLHVFSDDIEYQINHCHFMTTVTNKIVCLFGVPDFMPVFSFLSFLVMLSILYDLLSGDDDEMTGDFSVVLSTNSITLKLICLSFWQYVRWQFCGCLPLIRHF